MMKYQHVEQLKIGGSIITQPDDFTPQIVLELVLSYLHLLMRMWFGFLSLSDHWEKWQVFGLGTRGQLTAFQVEDQSTRVCDLFGWWGDTRGVEPWHIAMILGSLDCCKGTHIKT